MEKQIKVFAAIAIFLFMGGQPIMAEQRRDDVKAATAPSKKSEVHVKVGDVVSIAIGDSVSTRVHIADHPTPSTEEQKHEVHVGTIYHQVVGPQASVCVKIPFFAVEETVIHRAVCTPLQPWKGDGYGPK